jgi:RNA polymerase sigma factor (sigma-70 family)
MPARLLRLTSDERLVELLRGGSDAAFEVIYDRHHRGVLGFCRHMLGSVEEAEDAVQHTFLAAYREITGSGKPIQLRPWLYAIARNRSLTVLRTRARQSMGELQEPPTEHLASEVERRHDLRALLGDVSRLPDDQRAALVLSELGDLSHDEIAAVLGCRREKVKGLVFQARSSLIASRTAREISCAEIREQLATLTGGSLRRNEVRRHLADCEGCRDFRAAVRRQRADLALVLPVAPSVGLKAAVLGGGAAAVGTAGGAAVATKILIVAAIAGGGTAAVEVERKAHDAPAQPAAQPAVSGQANHYQAPAAAPASAPAPVTRPVRSAPAPVTKPAAKAPKERAKPVPPGHAKKQTATVPPGQAKKRVASLPPGQAKKQAKPVKVKAPKQAGSLPPGQAKQQAKPVKVKAPKQAGSLPPGQAKKQAGSLPPGQAKKQAEPVKVKAPKPAPAAAPVQPETAAPTPGKPDKPPKEKP